MIRVDNIVKNKLGVKPEKSSLKEYTLSAWRDFLKYNNFNFKTRGVYNPATYEAHILKDNDIRAMTFFHEYYGHGIFSEHSTMGKELVKASQIRDMQKVNEIKKRTLMHNEGFAIFMEDFLSESIGYDVLKKEFAKSITSYNNDMLQAYAIAKEAESYGDFYFKREFGFPESPTGNDMTQIISSLYPKANIQLAILYGSRKPESDVDLFIVSDDILTYKNHWLDVYAVSVEKFKHGIENLMINITDPIFSGEPIIGAREVEKAKTMIMKMPITDNAIFLNKKAAYQEQKIVEDRKSVV